MRLSRLTSISFIVAAGVACGIAIDTARAQVVPQCLNPNPGCPAAVCVGGGGVCVGGAVFNFHDDTAIGYTPCGPGAINNCPNPLRADPYCSTDGWATKVNGVCQGFQCSVISTTPGC
jgi:hypothetical protein